MQVRAVTVNRLERVISAQTIAGEKRENETPSSVSSGHLVVTVHRHPRRVHGGSEGVGLIRTPKTTLATSMSRRHKDQASSSRELRARVITRGEMKRKTTCS